MDWKLAMEEERAMLKRIVALLFALANLAESASRRSALVRRFVLWVLRRGEAVAWDFVVGEEPPLPLLPLTDDTEAIRLARSFRDLACELEFQANFAFAVEAGILDESRQADLVRFGACRALDMDDFLEALWLALAAIPRRATCATGPPTINCPSRFYPHP